MKIEKLVVVSPRGRRTEYSQRDLADEAAALSRQRPVGVVTNCWVQFHEHSDGGARLCATVLAGDGVTYYRWCAL